MHIPDGFVPLWQCAIYYVILIIAIYFAVKWSKKNLDEKRIPLMAILSAGIFAIMSMNIPIPFGTSGHMVGGALVALVFMAPEAGVIVFTCVLLIQALLFGDGGITVLGLNVLNMGIIGGSVGLGSYKLLNRFIGKYPSVAIGAWLATVISAIAAAIELALAGTFPIEIGLVSMVLYHVFIGIIEAALTVIVIYALEKFRPDLLTWNSKEYNSDSNRTELENNSKSKNKNNKKLIAVVVIICVALACLSPFIASSNPDGLEKSFEDANVSDEGIEAVVESPFPDYTFEPLSQFGEIGVLVLGAAIVAIIGFLVSIILKKKEDNDENEEENQLNNNSKSKNTNKKAHSHGIGQVLNLESVASGNSPIHKLDGRIKLISVLILIVFCVFSQQLIVPIILEIYLIILMYISDIPMKQSFKRVALLLPFGGFIIIFQPFIHPGHIIWASGISWINITDTGLNWAIILLARLIVCLTAIVLLSSTSPMQEIVQSFRKLGLPKDFAMILSIMVRFLFIFVDELESIRKAQKSRNFNIHNKALPYKWRLRQVGYTVAMMFLKAYEKGEKVYLSMTSRCFSDKSDMYNTKTKLDSSDYAYLIAIIIIVIGLEILVLTLAPKLGYFGLPLTL